MPLQMLSKAEEATVQVQQLLEKSLEKWLPNWMEKRYEKVGTRQIAKTLEHLCPVTSTPTFAIMLMPCQCMSQWHSSQSMDCSCPSQVAVPA